MAKDRMRHRRIDLPSYQFLIYEQPKTLRRRRSSSVDNFMNSVKQESKKHILSPITSDDIEVEICWATKIRQGIRADIDNIIKPIIDALCGIAYNDDKQVRSATATLFDLNKRNVVSGYVEDMGPLFYSSHPDAIQISIYSDTRLEELGGEEKIKKERSEKFTKLFEQSQNGV